MLLLVLELSVQSIHYDANHIMGPLKRMKSCHPELPPTHRYIYRDSTFRTEIKDTLYMRILKEEALMNWKYNMIVSAANWVLLARYLVILGTFTSLKESSQVEKALNKNNAGRAALNTIQNPPLLVIACLFLAVGATVLVLLYRKFRPNYTWLVNKLFM